MKRKSCFYYNKPTGCRKGLTCADGCPHYRRHNRRNAGRKPSGAGPIRNCKHKEICVIKKKTIRYCKNPAAKFDTLGRCRPYCPHKEKI
jgi:hypothetical protein